MKHFQLILLLIMLILINSKNNHKSFMWMTVIEKQGQAIWISRPGEEN